MPAPPPTDREESFAPVSPVGSDSSGSSDSDSEPTAFSDAVESLPPPPPPPSSLEAKCYPPQQQQLPDHRKPSKLSYSSRISPLRRKSSRENTVRRKSGNSFGGGSGGGGERTDAELEKDVALEADLKEVRGGLRLFLNSRFVEAEDCLKPRYGKTLYHTLGYAFIVCLKALMTFDPRDMEIAQKALQKTVELAGSLRANAGSGLMDSLASFFRGGGPGVGALTTMTRSQRHAELVHAEAHLLKAVLSVLNGDSVLALVKEGLAVKASHAVYRDLSAFLETTDPESLVDLGVDNHLTSGVALGQGLFNLLLSMLPGRYLKIVELIGFSGDRLYALDQLESVGKWHHEDNETAEELEEEARGDVGGGGAEETKDRGGLRRPFTDLTLLAYHTILSSFSILPYVDLRFAKRVLTYNLKRFPDGVLFLFFDGRLHTVLREIPEAIHSFRKAIDAQRDWRQIQHACQWEMGICQMLQRDWNAAYECYAVLAEESKWSKAVYTYHQAIMLYEEQGPSEKVDEMMKRIPKLVQKIAGKSIPIEKFVSRKSRKYIKQKSRLLLPSLELVLAWHSIDKMPAVHLERSLSEATKALTQLRDPSATGYHDDVALAQLIRGCCARELAFLRGGGGGIDESGTADPSFLSQSREAFAAAVAEGPKTELDHYVVPMALYERGVLYLRQGLRQEADAEFGRILDGTCVTDMPEGAKKYSLDGLISFRAHNARDSLTSGIPSNGSSGSLYF